MEKTCNSACHLILSFKVFLSENVKVRNVQGHVRTNVLTIDLNICLSFPTHDIIFLFIFFPVWTFLMALLQMEY